jgi:hypothetical protein
MDPEKEMEKAKAEASVPSKPVADPKELTPEEQMARFEASLKEDDWRHQPC